MIWGEDEHLCRVCSRVSKRRKSTIESQLVKTYPHLVEMSHVSCSRVCAPVTLEGGGFQDVKNIKKKVTVE
jgi:hypothetical protein